MTPENSIPIPNGSPPKYELRYNELAQLLTALAELDAEAVKVLQLAVKKSIVLLEQTGDQHLVDLIKYAVKRFRLFRNC